MADLDTQPVGFTAVNGKTTPSPHASTHDFRPGSGMEDIVRSAAAANGSHHARANSGTRTDQHRTTARPDDRPAPTSSAPSQKVGSPPRPDVQTDVNNADRSPSNRKRTYPEAFDESSAQTYAPRPPPRDSGDYRSPERYPDSAVHAQQNQPSQQERDSNDFDAQSSAHAGSPYSQDASQDETERHLVAALKADGLAHDPVRDAYENQDDGNQQHGSASYPPSEYNTPTRTAAGVAMNADRKRKRVFSNRTKTGCLTCRKRKKKCDELHPECNNCIRGGFVCEGYSSRTNWQRPTPQAKQPPVPLQSKVMGGGTYGGTPTRPQHPPYSEPPQEYPRGPELRPDDRNREPGLGNVTPRETNAPPYPPRPDGRFMGQLPPRYEPEHRTHEIHPEPAPHDPGMYPSAPTTAYPSHSAPVHPAPGPPPTAPMHPAPAVTQAAVAHAALQHVHSALPPASTLVSGGPLAGMSPASQTVLGRRVGEPSERDKMLQGEYYLPYTPALMTDRDQCAAAVYRFNQACQNPSLGFSHMDRERFFREVVALRPTPDPPASGSPRTNGTIEESNARPDGVMPQGSVGPGCVVEAPFHCDYGYNLNIGADVVIGANCRITDTCNVSIGNGVVLSPGVTLMCATYAIDPKERRKGRGRALGRGIVIEDEAWIGTNVTILPGVRVGRHSTVGAGSLIHKDVPPYTVMAGNPPKVVRGIGSDEPREI